MPTPRRIIIDTDPGQDDAVAILLALASPEIEVLGITAVAGNVPLPLTAKNARIVCELAGRPDLPVFAGCDAPLQRKLVTAEYVHGKTGLDGPALPDPGMALQDRHAVEFLIDTLRTEPAGTVTLCPIGPLTNIATAFLRAPDIVGRVQQVVLMGGAYFEVGNVTPDGRVQHLRRSRGRRDRVPLGRAAGGDAAGRDPQGADHEAADRGVPGAGHRAGPDGGRMDRFLRALRHGEIRP